jgi:hypothetical protein
MFLADGWAKKDIMTVSLSRALGRVGVPRFASVTYIGDRLSMRQPRLARLNFIESIRPT